MLLNKYIDHTVLKADATALDVEKICKEAIAHDFATVCVNPCRIAQAKTLLKGSNVGITTVIGFPLGASTSETKACETTDALKNGATEIDMVLNVGAMKDQNYELVLNDIKAVRQASTGHVLKVILETCLLSDAEIIKACQLSVEAGADFVKTSTGFSTDGANIHVVSLMKKTVGDAAKVKASGGVRTYQDAIEMIKAGADRLGTSGGVAIVNGQENTEKY
ncbi:deoxyribose-phosphate aldolase [Williamsoniiplasma luminosum]|uniref:Deoxyribose-phosphate aldolase n=1 Tax=Williamsoniiplasma luminosum TaxID=214888 RepID=A0A2S0NJ46_9MOLU|nr:deoxyribose-phosphate aldolase [Williamsoniiplasma luminosum]AVP49035.1 MAG: deoxyribose-phosphate aldolase [Williamsoniiplasma luminosum]